MLTGSPGPRQPRPSAPMCVELGSAPADGEILIQSKVLCVGFDQIEPRARGQRARFPSFHRCILNSIWEINRKSRNALNPSFVYKSCFEPRRIPAFNVSRKVWSHLHLCRSVIEYHAASKFSHCGEPIFGCSVGGEKKGAGWEKKPQILLPTLLRSRSQLCRFERLTAEHVAALLQSERLRLCN